MTVILIIAVILLFAFLGTSLYMFRFACLRKTPVKSVWDSDELFAEADKIYVECSDEVTAMRRSLRQAAMDGEKLSVTSYDGLRLAARLVPPANGEARGIVAMFHGYRSSHAIDFGIIAEELRRLGFMLLLADQRAHGESEGKYITYGVHERHDVLSWCSLLEERYPSLPVILFGLSMGASTVMMASELSLPANVKGIVADCGYTAPDDICRKVMKVDLHMPAFPIYYGASMMTRMIARFGFKEASAPSALKNLSLPLLIIHGEDDKFVPHEMGVTNSRAAGEKCDFVSFPGAGHGQSYITDPEKYVSAVASFIMKVGI